MRPWRIIVRVFKLEQSRSMWLTVSEEGHVPAHWEVRSQSYSLGGSSNTAVRRKRGNFFVRDMSQPIEKYTEYVKSQSYPLTGSSDTTVCCQYCSNSLNIWLQVDLAECWWTVHTVKSLTDLTRCIKSNSIRQWFQQNKNWTQLLFTVNDNVIDEPLNLQQTQHRHSTCRHAVTQRPQQLMSHRHWNTQGIYVNEQLMARAYNMNEINNNLYSVRQKS